MDVRMKYLMFLLVTLDFRLQLETISKSIGIDTEVKHKNRRPFHIYNIKYIPYIVRTFFNIHYVMYFRLYYGSSRLDYKSANYIYTNLSQIKLERFVKDSNVLYRLLFSSCN